MMSAEVARHLDWCSALPTARSMISDAVAGTLRPAGLRQASSRSNCSNRSPKISRLPSGPSTVIAVSDSSSTRRSRAAAISVKTCRMSAPQGAARRSWLALRSWNSPPPHWLTSRHPPANGADAGCLTDAWCDAQLGKLTGPRQWPWCTCAEALSVRRPTAATHWHERKGVARMGRHDSQKAAGAFCAVP